jgi:hypothetical protein
VGCKIINDSNSNSNNKTATGTGTGTISAENYLSHSILHRFQCQQVPKVDSTHKQPAIEQHLWVQLKDATDQVAKLDNKRIHVVIII